MTYLTISIILFLVFIIFIQRSFYNRKVNEFEEYSEQLKRATRKINLRNGRKFKRYLK